MKQTIISLRWRMILLVAVIPLLVLIPIFLVFGNRFTSAYREAYWKKADIIAKQVVYSLDELGFSSQSEDSNGINNALVNYLSASGLDGIQDFEFIALVDANGYIVGHSTPELAGTVDDRLTNLNQDTVYKRTGNSDPQDVMWVKRRQFLTEDYYLITHPLPLSDTGDTQLYIVISENVTLVNPPIMSLIITGGILVILVIIIMQIFLNNTILSPLHAIAEGATVIGAGDLEYRINLDRKDELGLVADSFNSMTAQISDLVTSLESTVKTRTSALEKRNLQLETVTLVGQEVVQQRNVTALLDSAVKTISEKFGFYHTAIFLLDDDKNWAILRAVSSEGGLRMLNRGHRLRVGEEGMVGNVAFTRKPRIALDVGEDAVFFRNPDLQTTRSEMAIPLVTDDEVIGVLDIQSEEQAAFTTGDISVLQLLANQLAVALSNVRVLEVMQSTLEELRSLQTDFSQRGWARQVRSDRPTAYEYDRADTTPVAPIPLPADLGDGQVEDRIIMDGDTPVVIEALKAGDRTLGYLGLSDSNRTWTADELSLVHSVGEQIALALDNARLFEDTQRNERQQLLISQMLQTASNPETPPDLILKEIATILAGGLDVGVVIAVLPVPELPIIHPLAVVDPDGQKMDFLNNDVSVDPDFLNTLKNLTQPTIRSMGSIIQIAQESADYYDFDHVHLIPILGGGTEVRFIGLIQRYGDTPLDQDTRDLAQNLANQIAVVMDNLDLSEETRQRSEELRHLYQSSLRLSELLEPADVLQAIAEEGTKLLRADASNVWVYHSESKELVLTYDHLGGAEGRIGNRMRVDDGLLGQSITEQRSLTVGDYNSWDGHIVGMVSSKFQAVLSVPLIGRLGPLGGIVFLAKQPEVFEEREISLADLFSAQAASALENAQLNQDTQRRAEEFSHLYEAGIDLISILDAEQLLTRAAEWAQSVFSADRAVLYLRHTDTTPPLCGQSCKDESHFLNEELDQETRNGLTDIIIQSKDSILINDNRDHPALRMSPMVDKGFLSLVGVPLQVGDDVLGAMYLYSVEVNHYNNRDLTLLEFLATQVSSALQNSIQFGQTERALSVVVRQARYQSNISRAVALLTERGTASEEDVLQLVAEAAEAPVALYFDAHIVGGNAYWQLKSYWIAPELSSEKVSDLQLQYLEVKRMPDWAAILSEQSSFVARLNDLPESIREILSDYDYSLMMTLAVQGEVDFPGFIALLRDGDTVWENQEVVALQTTAAALSNTMARERLFEQVQQTLSETEALYRGGAALSQANTYQSILDVLLTHTVLGKGSADVTLQLFSSMWSESDIPDYAEVVAYWSSENRLHSRQRFYVKEFPSAIDIVQKGVPVFVEDVARDPILDRRARAMFSKALGAASVILVPLVVGGQRVGYIHATYPERQNFSEYVRRQLANLAQQAAIAVLNIQQLRATEARVRREQLIRQITGRVQEAPDVEGVLQTAIRELGRAFSTSRNKIQFQLPKNGAEDVDAVKSE